MVLIIILGVILVIYLYNNGKNHTMVDPDVHRYNFIQTDNGEWVDFPTVFKLTGNNDIIIHNPTEKIVVLDVVEIEPNKFTGTLNHFKIFTTVYSSINSKYSYTIIIVDNGINKQGFNLIV